MNSPLSERGLILAPVGRDSLIAQGILHEGKIRSITCSALPELVRELETGAGFALVTEESLRREDMYPLAGWLQAQAEWSDFPFILLTARGGGIERNPAAGRLLAALGNVTFLERPFHPTTLISLAESALRGRRRQYEARARLNAVNELNETLEARVADALAERRILAEIVEATDAFVQVLDLDFNFIAINRASVREFEQVFGIQAHAGDNMLALLKGREGAREAEALWGRALGGEEFSEVHPFADRDGRPRFYEIKFNTLKDRHGKRIGAYQFVYDVTKRLDNEMRLATANEALRQAQKMEAVGQLTGGVAHDFNNLLTVISGGLNMLERSPDPKRAEFIKEAMNQAVDRGSTLTRQLLAFSRNRPLETKTIDLARQIDSMSEMLDRALRGDVNVAIDCPHDVGIVDVDPVEFELALLNLCVNARDAIPRGGAINVSVRQTIAGKVELSVADTGVGMSEPVKARVFEPFFTTKEIGKGSGLGLAQVYGFAVQSRASVDVESELGAGTRITLTFPLSEKAPEHDAPAKASIGNDAQLDARILFVEDDKQVAALTVAMFETIGCHVHHVPSASDALAALAADCSVDVVFSDVMMPGSFNGVDLAKMVQQRWPAIPIILATGYVEAARDAARAGIEVLEKPFKIDTLEQVIRRKISAR